MKHSLLILSILFCSLNFFGQKEIIKEANLQFKLPNNKWKLEKNNQSQKEGILYMYVRDPIINTENKEIQPVIAFIIEELPNDSADVITYSILKRRSTPFEVKEVFSWENKILVFKNAIGYKSTYISQDTEHTIYVVHLINNKKGVQIIMDITSDLFNDYGKEFLTTLKSIKSK